MSEHEPAAAAQARGVGEAEAWEAIADWALRLAAAPTEDERLRQGVLAVCDLVPSCHAASAVLVRHHRRVAEVAVGEDADAAEEAQDRHDEGPGLSALRTGVAEHVADLDAETRWPRWAHSAREAGLGAALALPLPRSHGVLTLYAPRAGGFSADDLAAAGALATLVDMAVAAGRELASRSSALVNRTVIGQAQGILMERFRATPQEAFAMLRAASQRTNHKLSAVAAVVAETGQLP